ncbi:hypothetical protein [Elioraea sp.]|uniref:hypothetical protein n=1 Tax=Elioraea sp. TaxID=2185103 RepID=UPI00307D8306
MSDEPKTPAEAPKQPGPGKDSPSAKGGEARAEAAAPSGKAPAAGAQPAPGVPPPHGGAI